MLLAILSICIFSTVTTAAQPIFDYVSAPDDAFSWQIEKTEDSQLGGETIHLKMTSQVWRGIEWQHRMAIAKPARITHPEYCTLVIVGGNPAGEMFNMASMIAGRIGAPIAVLGDIPNQPLFDDLSEDALISYTFSRYLQTGDATWPLLFPMTKAAVRAMDAIQQLSGQQWQQKVGKFIITGASKRGWTTWFTGEVDPRVAGIIPLVYDNLNLPAQMKHQIEQWGEYSAQINDYTERGLPQMLAGDDNGGLAAIVDPYTYRDRADMPKLIVSGTNDPYWPLDAANSYFEQLTGPKYLLYVPNSGHGLDDRMRALLGLGGFAATIAAGRQLPDLQSEFTPADDGLKLTAKSDIDPQRVLLWRATSDDSDFRDAKWTRQEIEPDDDDCYSHTESAPNDGYVSWFFEFTFRIGSQNIPLSTQLRILGPENGDGNQDGSQ